MSVNGNMSCGQRLWETSITATTTTRGKILSDHAPGGLALPDNAGVGAEMPQVARGGQRVIGGSITSTEASTARDVLVYRGTTLTTQGTATGTLAVATTSTITRTAGDFRLDGWTVGDSLMVFGAGPTTWCGHGAPDYSNNGSAIAALASAGVLGVLTGVAALTLTVNGTPLTAESLAGCRIIRVGQGHRSTVAAGAGNAAATPAVLLIGGANDVDINALSAADRGLSLGERDVLIVAAAATISALPAQLNFNATSVLY